MRHKRFWAKSPKYILSLAALVVVAFVFLMPTTYTDYPDLSFEAGSVSNSGGKLRLDAPELSGTTNSGEPFSIRADWAEPDSLDPDKVALQLPRGNISLESGVQASLTARQGIYRPKTSHLLLEGEIKLQTDSGYQFHTERAEFDGRDGKLIAPGAIRATGPEGGISAGRMSSGENDGKRIFLFEGGVKVMLKPNGPDND